jgi:hypothetical protein
MSPRVRIADYMCVEKVRYLLVCRQRAAGDQFPRDEIRQGGRRGEPIQQAGGRTESRYVVWVGQESEINNGWLGGIKTGEPHMTP